MTKLLTTTNANAWTARTVVRLAFEGKVKRTPGTNATKRARLKRLLIISIYYLQFIFLRRARRAASSYFIRKLEFRRYGISINHCTKNSNNNSPVPHIYYAVPVFYFHKNGLFLFKTVDITIDDG